MITQSTLTGSLRWPLSEGEERELLRAVLFERIEASGDFLHQRFPQLPHLAILSRKIGIRWDYSSGRHFNLIEHVVCNRNHGDQQRPQLAQKMELVDITFPGNLLGGIYRTLCLFLWIRVHLAQVGEDCTPPSSELASSDKSGKRKLFLEGGNFEISRALLVSARALSVLPDLIYHRPSKREHGQQCLRPRSRRGPPVQWVTDEKTVIGVRHGTAPFLRTLASMLAIPYPRNNPFAGRRP